MKLGEAMYAASQAEAEAAAAAGPSGEEPADSGEPAPEAGDLDRFAVGAEAAQSSWGEARRAALVRGGGGRPAPPAA